MVEKAFKVLTEFKFEIGAAVAASKTLQGAVDDVSTSAEQAMFSLSRLSVGLAYQIGFGQLSVAGAFYNAVKASDKFYQSQIKLANVMQSAGFFKGPQAFEEAMSASKVNLEKISQIARDFSLPAQDLLDTTSLLAPVLLSKGLDNAGLSKSMDLSRQFLKASPILGTDPSLAMNQLVGAVMGRVDMGGQFSQRLFADTKALAPFAGAGGTQKFNALAPEKRLQLLTQALGEFADNTRAAEAIAGSFSGQMQLLRDTLLGAFSILKPLGDALMKPILMALRGVNSFLQNEGRKIVENFSKILASVLADPKGLLVSILQGGNLSKDLKATGSALGLGGILMGIGEGIKYLGGTALFAHPIVGILGMSMSVFAESLGRAFPLLAPVMSFFTRLTTIIGVLVGLSTAIYGWAATMAGLKSILVGLVTVVRAVFWPFMILMGIFQVLSRAAAIARVADVMDLPRIMAGLSESFVHLKNLFFLLMEPVFSLVDAVAQALSPIFRMSFLLEGLKWILDGVIRAITEVVGSFQGLVFALGTMIMNIKSILSTGNFDISRGMLEAFEAGRKDIFDKVYGKLEEGDSSVVAQMTTNIGKVEINNDFKEQLEPDRIAFSLVSQLQKVALNPQQATGRSLRSALVGQ